MDEIFEISIHALRAEGDGEENVTEAVKRAFQSTPSVRRATFASLVHFGQDGISIHALRAEGDVVPSYAKRRRQYFNPRPPCGGRPSIVSQVWRQSCDFNPRPPCGGRQMRTLTICQSGSISIHALRAEGDKNNGQVDYYLNPFQSTPSVRRAT